ncbi:hypothetical protein [Ruania rhizosphaerae]|uniref:hypothetical protein n=1 Tax=Ruania rhizosphaerae TaxID=1840413 RepID=UPI0013592E6E|nr:hypothetical protein [Ruania rhizosphaerae]
MSEDLVQRGWRYSDHVPYSTPPSLTSLRGPTSGVIRVPHHINTAPQATYDLDDAADLWAAYSAIVRDGHPEDHIAFLNREVLLRLWPDLNLPRRCREAWTSAFPELRVLPVRALVV